MEFENVSNKELKETLIDFILPFVNADPKAAVNLFIEFYASDDHIEKERADFLADFGKPMPRSSEIIEGIRRYRLQFRAQAKEIQDLQKMIRSMLTIAIRGKRGESISDIPIDVVEEIEDRINKAFERGNPAANWRGVGGTYLTYDSNPDLNMLHICSSFIIHDVVKAFEFLPAPGGKPFRAGPGFDWLGLCPNCGIFFEKNRKNQEYCSKRCKDAKLMRIYRNKKKCG